MIQENEINYLRKEIDYLRKEVERLRDKNKEFGKIKQNERELFYKMFAENPNLKKAPTAKSLGVSRQALYRWINEIKSK